jgi:hypothetical protein
MLMILNPKWQNCKMDLKKRMSVFLVVGTVLGICSTVHAITIAQHGNSTAIIVVDKEASLPQQHAAKELADFLKQVTGAELPVVNNAPADQPRLLIGPAAARLVDANFTTDYLGAEGIVIKTVDNDLVLAGGEPRGTLYAIYSFLEDYVGCRWWTSKASSIPKKPNLSFENLDIQFVPVLEFRESFWLDAFDGNWAVRNKINGHHADINAKQGGKWYVHECINWCHTFHNLIPPDKYFDAHPEWFSMINGVRSHKLMAQYAGTEYEMPSQLCLTNEDMRLEMVKNLKEKFQKNPQITYFSVSQMDTFPGFDGCCECPDCKAVEAEEDSPAGLIIRFVNKVAEDIEKDFPNIPIGTLAYGYTKKPPKLAKPRPNVIVTLCNGGGDFFTPLQDDIHKDLHDYFGNWSKICKRLWVWDYVTNHGNYIIPHPNLRVLAPNIRFFIANNAKGVFSQGAGASDGAEMSPLKAWMLAKLLWNPDLNGQKLVDEFVTGYYGPAAKDVSAYLNLIHDAVTSSGDVFHDWTMPIDANFLSFEMLSQGWGYLKAAEKAVKDDPEMRLRIQVAQLPVMHVFILRWDEFHDKAAASNTPWPMHDSIDEALNHFKEVARKANITHLGEGTPIFEALDSLSPKSKI